MPKYLRLRNAIAGAIADGRWKAGARIPTEESLTEGTGVSLGTVQRALGTLADDSIIVRRYPARCTGPWSAHLGNPGIVCIERSFSIDNELSICTVSVERSLQICKGEGQTSLKAEKKVAARKGVE